MALLEVTFYENGEINPKLFDDIAKEIASNLVKREKYQDKNGKQKEKVIGVSRNQFRKIYQDVKQLERSFKKNKNFNSIFPSLKMIKPKTAYLVAKIKDNDKNKKYYDNFLNFITTTIDKINPPRDFEVFCLFLEAVYAYYYSLGGSKTEE
ncbi:MAG: type III-A CRISPR-associated protein Csm2 [Brevinematia bacterium]